MTGDVNDVFCSDWPELALDAQMAHPWSNPLVIAVHLSRVTLRRELLDDREQARAARLRTPDLQRAFIAAHTVLRQLLGWYLGRDPARLAFTIDFRGKPHLTDGAIHFNLSHGDSVALIAVGNTEYLGVDVERLDRLRDADRLAERVLAASELAVFQALPAEERSNALLRTWTRKEAVLKALGVGLPGGMERVVIADQPLRLMGDMSVFPQLSTLHLDDLPVSAGYAAALCQGPGQQSPVLRRWPDAHVLR
jgi:4'-phosphopantetheinyl transferase